MKYSVYNSHIQLTDKTSVIYNALSDQFLLLPNGSYSDKLEELKANNPKLFNVMVKGGHIVETSKDEIALVKELQEKVDFDNRTYQLIINPTLNCNFRCWYCYETHLKDSYMTAETKTSVEHLIDRLTSEGISHFSLGFFGGEPLLHFLKVVKPLIIYANQCCKEKNVRLSVNFTTNGYLINESMVEFFKANSVNMLQITLDGGPEEHNKTRFLSNGTGSYEKIINNIKLLLKNKISVTLRINCTGQNIFSTEHIANDLKDIPNDSKPYLDIHFQQVWQNSKDEDIEDSVNQMIDVFDSLGLKSSIYVFDNVRNSCYGDKKNSMLVNYNGNVYKCTALDFVKTKRDGFLDDTGNVHWENDSLDIRLNAKFKNKPCLSCRILPICNGACSQKALEYKEQDYCILSFDEKRKDNAILARFKKNVLFNPDWKKF